MDPEPLGQATGTAVAVPKGSVLAGGSSKEDPGTWRSGITAPSGGAVPVCRSTLGNPSRLAPNKVCVPVAYFQPFSCPSVSRAARKVGHSPTSEIAAAMDATCTLFVRSFVELPFRQRE